MRGEVPLMTFGIFRSVAAVTVELVLRFLDDRGACRLRLLIVRVNIIDIDIQALSCLTEMLGVLVVRSRMSHHNHRVTMFHRRVHCLSVSAAHSVELLKSEGPS